MAQLHPGEKQVGEKEKNSETGAHLKAKSIEGSTRQLRGLEKEGASPREIASGRHLLAQIVHLAGGAQATDAVPRKGTQSERQEAKRQLLAARQQVAKTTGGPLPGLGQEEAHIAREVLKVGRAVGASRKEMLAAIDTGLQETGFKNLKPYENGFGEDTAGWREELAPYYSGRLNVKKSAREFFKETKTDPAIPGGRGETPGELAQTVQGSAFGGEETYGTHDAQAQQILGAFNHGTGTSPAAQKARESLAQAKAKAVGLGIPLHSGDAERGGGHVVFVRADAKGMVGWAKALLGTQEGSRLQLKWAAKSGVSAAEPWCSEFIAAGVARRGLPMPADPAYSGSWLTWKGGKNIGTNLQQAKPGDILVFGPTSHTAHVGLYIGNGQMISGNYGNEVAQAPVSQETASEPIAGIVRPGYKGGKVAVHESAVLPGAAIGPGGAIVSGPAGAGAVGGGTAPGSEAQQVANSQYGRFSAALSPLNPLIAPRALTPAVSGLELSEEPSLASVLSRRTL
jgi:cell wall-associated NlpC family hydrolase